MLWYWKWIARGWKHMWIGRWYSWHGRRRLECSKREFVMWKGNIWIQGWCCYEKTKKKQQKVIRYHNISLNENKEGHYRQMIMLFTKWRNEKVDLLHGCSSYEESYIKMRNAIEATKTRYMKIGSEIDESILEGLN